MVGYGFCECGCGEKTVLSKANVPHKRQVLGEPKRFVAYHQNRVRVGDKSGHWKGGKSSCNGYAQVLLPNHPRANSKGYVFTHILKATEALGKPIPIGSVVHHHTEIQLVICENQGYHLFIHARSRAYNATGNANYLKCKYCHEYDDPVSMYVSHTRCDHYHRKCRNLHDQKRREQHGRKSISEERAD